MSSAKDESIELLLELEEKLTEPNVYGANADTGAPIVPQLA